MVGLVVAGLALVLPVAALVVAIRASRGKRELLARVTELERHLWNLELYVRPRPTAPVAPTASSPAVEPAPVAPAGAPPETPSPVAVPSPAIAPALLSETPSPTATSASTPVGDQVAAPAPAVAREPSAEAFPPPRVTPASPAPGASIEERLGLTWLTRIGAGVFLLGALFFFKYAVDNAWIGPAGRVAIGCVVGLGLIATAEAIRAKTKPRFVNAFMGIGLSTLLVSLWASAVFYDLVP